MEYEVEGARPRGSSKRTWTEVVQKDCQARNLNKEDAMDRGRWKKLIKIGCIRMMGGRVFLMVPAHPGSPGQKVIKWLCCCCVEDRRGILWITEEHCYRPNEFPVTQPPLLEH